jgi:hypothetical protein
MFLETSAKTAYNVVEAFNLSALSILNNTIAVQGDNSGSSSNSGNNNSKVLLNSNVGNNKTNAGKQGCC